MNEPVAAWTDMVVKAQPSQAAARMMFVKSFIGFISDGMEVGQF